MSTSCTIPGLNVPKSRFPEPESDLPTGDNREQRVVLGGGCFWCVEAVFLAVNGVSRVESGYAGGTAETANYEAVCGGQTGHAEVVDVHYDPQTVSFGEILKVFFSVAHDPTQLNRQGNDRGTQYRSAIFPLDEAQEEVARASVAAAEEAGLWDDPIVTSIEPLAPFYVAEDYHQDYFANNPDQGYCVAVVGPKVQKFKALFADKLKANRP